MFQFTGLHATPIDVRRMTISEALTDYILGKKTDLEVERLLSTLNTSRPTAKQYYDIKNKREVRHIDQKKNNLIFCLGCIMYYG